MSSDSKEMDDTTAVPETKTSAKGKRGSYLSWVLTIAGLGVLATYLMLSKPPKIETQTGTSTAVNVQITERGTLRVPQAGPFAEQLRRVSVTARRTATPLIDATGTLLAAPSMDGSSQSAVRWQFATGELLSTYAELLQADADVVFQTRQAQTTRTLHDTKVRTQTQVVDRLRRLVEVGSDSARDLAAEEANLLERRLEGDRAIHEVDNALKAAQRKQAALVRQLEQAGLSPDLLRRTDRGRILVVAEIPESRIEQVRENQACSVRFFGHPNAPKTGRVAKILPTVSTAQRTLRVVVVLDDATDATLRPGMFANVALGTEERDAIIGPQSALVHVGRSDYVLVVSGDELVITPGHAGREPGERYRDRHGRQLWGDDRKRRRDPSQADGDPISGFSWRRSMIRFLVRTALRFRIQVIALAGLLLALGVWALINQRVDAYPDISSQMVQVITVYPGRAPEEVRGRGSIQTIHDLESIFVKSVGGTPVYLRDVASVQIDHRVPSGIFSRNRTDGLSRESS
jgi:multidrug efflux pump subunit AcrA (membrane-fusion protein)